MTVPAPFLKTPGDSRKRADAVMTSKASAENGENAIRVRATGRHNGRDAASEAQDHRDERLPVKPEQMHQFIHTKRRAYILVSPKRNEEKWQKIS